MGLALHNLSEIVDAAINSYPARWPFLPGARDRVIARVKRSRPKDSTRLIDDIVSAMYRECSKAYKQAHP